MSNERYLERLSEYSKVLTRLKDALNQPENEFTRDASIQRFEFTYELAWKTLKNWLATKDIDVRNAKDTLKAVHEQGLIQDASAWSNLHQHRNMTSHTHDEALAKEVYNYLKIEGVILFEALEQVLTSS